MSSLNEFYAQLDGYIARSMEARRTPGVALALFDRERNVRASAYGFSELETRTPVAP